MDELSKVSPRSTYPTIFDALRAMKSNIAARVSRLVVGQWASEETIHMPGVIAVGLLINAPTLHARIPSPHSIHQRHQQPRPSPNTCSAVENRPRPQLASSDQVGHCR